MASKTQYLLGAIYGGIIRLITLLPFFIPLILGVFVVMEIPFYRETALVLLGSII